MIENRLAPICLFVYNRIEETRLTIEALQKNYLAPESELFIFSDGYKDEIDRQKVKEVRLYIRTIKGFKSITIYESRNNKGLAPSIIAGVTKVLNIHGKVIVVEDDLLLSSNFLEYMNQSLSIYSEESKVFSISGFCLKIKKPKYYAYDVFMWGRAHSWGWATWQDRWETIDWEIKDWDTFSCNKEEIKKFNSFGTDLFRMLKNSIEGHVSSWFIRFTYNQFKQEKLTVYPFLSKVINNGFMHEATHCNSYNRNLVNFDQTDQDKYSFTSELVIDENIRKQLFHYKSYSYRIVGKLLTILMRSGIIKQKKQNV